LAERSLVSPLRSFADPACSRDVTAARASSHRVGLDSRVRLKRLAPYWLMLPPWASIRRARPKADQVLCSSWYAAPQLRKRMVHTLSRLSCPSSRVQSISEPTCLRPPAPSAGSRTNHTASTSVLRRPPMGFCGSTTLADRSSDLHRGCLSRLCCAFRFSRPLDALIPPLPFRPCFMPVAPLSFRLQRVPPPDSRNASRRRLPLMPLRVVRRQHLEQHPA
jgi:hypothetical protein